MRFADIIISAVIGGAIGFAASHYVSGQPDTNGYAADMADARIDERCGYCKRSLENVMTLVKDDPTLRVVMKEFPILGPESVVVTRVSLAANSIDPSRYSDLHSALMTHRGGYDKASLLAVVAENGYDPAKVEEAMGSQGVSEQIKNAYEIAEALGIRGTPAFVIGDRVIPGAVSTATLREAIETARGASKG